MAQRTRYKNRDPIHLVMTGCDRCSPSRINGVLCHEAGCSNAWKDTPKKCSGCGSTVYTPKNSGVILCHRHRR